MNQAELFTDLVATIVYPGLTAVSLFWMHIAVARWLSARRLIDILLLLVATFATATFLLLSLSTGVFIILSFEQFRLAIRLGWLATLLSAIWLTAEYLRRQHATYQQRK